MPGALAEGEALAGLAEGALGWGLVEGEALARELAKGEALASDLVEGEALPLGDKQCGTLGDRKALEERGSWAEVVAFA